MSGCGQLKERTAVSCVVCMVVGSGIIYGTKETESIRRKGHIRLGHKGYGR